MTLEMWLMLVVGFTFGMPAGAYVSWLAAKRYVLGSAFETEMERQKSSLHHVNALSALELAARAREVARRRFSG